MTYVSNAKDQPGQALLDPKHNLKNPFPRVFFSADSKLVQKVDFVEDIALISTGYKLHLINLKTGKELLALNDFTKDFNSCGIKFSKIVNKNDKNYIVVAFEVGPIRIIDLNTKRQVDIVDDDAPDDIAVVADRIIKITAGSGIKIWNLDGDLDGTIPLSGGDSLSSLFLSSEQYYGFKSDWTAQHTLVHVPSKRTVIINKPSLDLVKKCSSIDGDRWLCLWSERAAKVNKVFFSVVDLNNDHVFELDPPISFIKHQNSKEFSENPVCVKLKGESAFIGCENSTSLWKLNLETKKVEVLSSESSSGKGQYVNFELLSFPGFKDHFLLGEYHNFVLPSIPAKEWSRDVYIWDTKTNTQVARIKNISSDVFCSPSGKLFYFKENQLIQIYDFLGTGGISSLSSSSSSSSQSLSSSSSESILRKRKCSKEITQATKSEKKAKKENKNIFKSRKVLGHKGLRKVKHHYS